MRRSPRNLRIACNHAGLTHFGGLFFFHEFLRALQVRDFLARYLAYSRNGRYSVSQMILALVYPIVLGLERIETASFLRSNGTFQYLTGLPSFPDPHLAPLLSANATAILGTSSPSKRSTAAQLHSFPRPSFSSHLRFRQYGRHDLRPSRRCRGWLPPPLSW